MLSATRFRASAVALAMPEPFCTLAMLPAISSPVFLAACADLLARLRTSSATTAKPLPASPARAASTAALSARILVWKAMSSMTLIILLISADEPAMASIAASMLSMCPPPCSTSSCARWESAVASRAFWAFCFTCRAMSWREAESSSMELACSTAPCERA
ncbi:hypothetical protein SDC9_192069 [bioreactor metagenome]|uniref:Uncharacterized protein n=1 Tax=bioreactor metagenome TaxID=1076179 RepID=A0A645I862_9ZZZZ